MRTRDGVLRFDPCTYCGSSDNLGIFIDGEWCFTPGCGELNYREKQSGQFNVREAKPGKISEPFIPEGIYRDVPLRGLHEKTCRLYNYHYAKYTGTFTSKDGPIPVQDCDVAVLDVKDKFGNVVWQKVRGPKYKDKSLWKSINHPGKGNTGLLGKEHWEAGKKRLIITTGAEDMLACAEAMGYTMNVASLPDGDGSVWAMEYDYDDIMRHELIILFFDNDKSGQQALEQAKKIIPPSKACFVDRKEKDACELKAKDNDELKFAILKAEPVPPLTRLRGIDVDIEDILKPSRTGFHLSVFPMLDYCLNGWAKGEFTIWAGGAKLGKTDAISRIEYGLVTEHRQKIADIKIESSEKKNIQQFISLDLHVPFKVFKENPRAYEAQVRESYNKLMPYFVFYKHDGISNTKSLIELMYYCHTIDKVDFIVIDNLTAAISGSDGRDGERKDIDRFLWECALFAKRTGVGVHLIVHLKNEDRGQSWLQGKFMNDFGQMRGSGNIGNIGENILFVWGQTKKLLKRDGTYNPFDKTVRGIGVLATREGRKDMGIADFYRLNEKTWDVEICQCPWIDTGDSD